MTINNGGKVSCQVLWIQIMKKIGKPGTTVKKLRKLHYKVNLEEKFLQKTYQPIKKVWCAWFARNSNLK